MLNSLIRKILRRTHATPTAGAKYRVCAVTKGTPGFQTVDHSLVSRF